MSKSKITPIKAFNDNYMWCLQNGKHAIVVDPGDPDPVISHLSKEKLKLGAVLITHHHPDHVGGNKKLVEKYGVPIYGPKMESIPEITHKLQEGDEVSILGIEKNFTVIELPGHTLGHIGYYGNGIIFCGDTLFSCGCGRLFEGTAKQMYESLQKIYQLPSNTLVCCGHEYTQANVEFARHLDPTNKRLIEVQKRVRQLRGDNLPTVPVTLKQEKETNPFLRTFEKDIVENIKKEGRLQGNKPYQIFSSMRQWKDDY